VLRYNEKQRLDRSGDLRQVFTFEDVEPLFPWPGGKAKPAAEVWRRLGAGADVYWEPFAGAAAVFFARPGGPRGQEIVNDKCGFITNLYRTVRHDPDGLIERIEGPRSQIDMAARSKEMRMAESGLVESLLSDPNCYDTELAAFFLMNVCGALRPLDFLQPRPTMRLGGGSGIYSEGGFLVRSPLIHALSSRLESVQLSSRDWKKLAGSIEPKATLTTAVFLDPPYKGDAKMYGFGEVAGSVQRWAIKNGEHPNMRIAICGRGELVMPEGWTMHQWKASQGEDRDQERIWFSPHCTPAEVAS
jgi:hypothetical protein